MSSRYPQADLSRLRRASIWNRQSKVHIRDFGRPVSAGASVRELLDSLPRILAADSLRSAAKAIAAASRCRRSVVVCIGGHVIKTGLAPVLIDLMRRGVLTAVATNGAGAIHDVEIALFGHTSEYVESGIGDGVFGVTQETADFLNRAVLEGSKLELGFGESVGRALVAADCPNRGVSLFAAAYEMRIPVTVHVGIGTDVVHMHPSADGAAIGDTSHRDFRILIEAMRDLGRGGVLMNIGSAVVLPEVVLKALTVLRNLGVDLAGFTGINMDFVQHYRSNQQVVNRVAELGAEGISLTGHHEIMVPLLAAAVLEEMGEREHEGEEPH
ncbi:MAG: hypothetical protein KatS3mg024_1864 [Armatimonadota bacterium]|nr:MAG: hypothetical protein KatS3mg024_1864 [Armatimonadota bacterium]